MNESVTFSGEPAFTRNSLIVIGLPFRTFSAVVSLTVLPSAGSFQDTRPTRSPLNGADPDVTVNVALTLAPGATTFPIVVETTALHCRGTVMLNVTPVTGAPVVFVNVSAVCCEEPGENVCSPGGIAAAAAGVSCNRGTSYPAATTFACTNWSVASLGNVP